MKSRVMALVATLGMVFTMLGVAPAQAAEPASGAEENLGYPIATQVLSPESSIGVAEDGTLLAFYVTNGNEEVPAMLQVVDVEDESVVFQQRVPVGINSWANAHSDVEHRVYFATTDGHFYSWGMGDADITQHDFPLGDGGEGIWRLTVAPDGTVFGGTYPGGLLFSFDPDTQEVTNHGQVIEGETYVRSIAVDDDYAYVGSQPNAKLVRWDRETGDTTELPMPDGVSGQSAMYDLTIAGDYLFARVEPLNTLIVYELDDLTIANVVPKITGRVISEPDPTGEFVLFRLNNGEDPTGIYRYYLDDHRMEAAGFNPNAFPGYFLWHEFEDQDRFPGHTLVMTYYRGRTYAHNFQSRQGLYIGESVLEATPNPIQEIGAGPDGKIYVPGFLSPPGIAQFDPATDTTTLLAGAGQVEGVGSFDDLLLLGRYPNGQLTAWDTNEPWAYGTNPPTPFEIGHEQDRPQSFARVGDEVAVSSVPKSGRLGGAITMWNPLTGDTRVFLDLVEDQSPVSLAEHDGLLYAGTSINGGYGIDPVATEAKLIVVDPDTGEVEFEVAPLPNAATVSGLQFGPDGMLWGIADGALFQFDTEAREVHRIEQTFPRTRTMYGTTNVIEFGQDGYLYATSAGALWRVDTETWERVRLAHNGVRYLAQDEDGNLYYARVASLYRWNFDLPSTIDGTAPVTEAAVANDGGTIDDVAVTLTATDTGGAGIQTTQYRIDDGEWIAYEAPISFDEAGEYTVHFRSVDNDQNVEGAKSIRVTVASAPDPDPDPDPREPATSFVAPVTLAGRDANAWGRVDGEASVSTQVKLPSGEWSTSQTREPDEDGFYVIPLTYGKDNAGTLEWRVRVTYADGTVEFGEPMTQQRIARTTFAVAADTVVGRDSNAWGRVDGRATVSTQVKDPNGSWSTSQVRETEADGSYVIPLTYGKDSAGALQWRVVVQHDNGLVEFSPVLAQERHVRPSAAHAGAKLVGENTYVWGSVDVDAPTRVFTQVWVNGAWSTSQTGPTTADGGYTLELTYGKHQGGTYRYRVGAEYPGIGFLFSDEFALVRTIR